eukprot:scaffold276380_cov18-Tisochrysis_lutea.AAC.1
MHAAIPAVRLRWCSYAFKARYAVHYKGPQLRAISGWQLPFARALCESEGGGFGVNMWRQENMRRAEAKQQTHGPALPLPPTTLHDAALDEDAARSLACFEAGATRSSTRSDVQGDSEGLCVYMQAHLLTHNPDRGFMSSAWMSAPTSRQRMVHSCCLAIACKSGARILSIEVQRLYDETN